jgi:hypothetical protein
LLDKVAVKGRTISSGIYTVKRKLTEIEERAWEKHAEGMELYYARDFKSAYYAFGEVYEILPADRCSRLLQDRCQFLLSDPPDDSWDGTIAMAVK